MSDSLVPVMLSALQHFSYCPRQCALIHQEQTFSNNVYTVKGYLAHARVDSGESSTEYGVRTERALPLYSEHYGLVGKADAVEFHADGRIYPVEYKQGKRQKKTHDEVQLAAQALCLEEMTGKHIGTGAIFHHKSRRRREVIIDQPLREKTLFIANQVRELLSATQLPPPTDDPSLCQACSLIDDCQPDLVRHQNTVNQLRPKLFITEDN